MVVAQIIYLSGAKDVGLSTFQNLTYEQGMIFTCGLGKNQGTYKVVILVGLNWVLCLSIGVLLKIIDHQIMPEQGHTKMWPKAMSRFDVKKRTAKTVQMALLQINGERYVQNGT